MTPRIEVVTEPARFRELAGVWQSLWQAANGRIFQRHDWLAGWLDGVQERREIRLHVVLAWNGDVLAGALPCAVHRRSGLRVLQWAAQLFSDYCDSLIHPAHDAGATLSAMWDAMWRQGGFDLVSLQQVRPNAVCRSFLDRLAQRGVQLHPGDRTERCMGIANQWPSGEAFFRSLNKKGRNNHTRGKRILSEIGGEVCFRVIEPGADAEPALAEVLRLKDIWLRQNDPHSPLLAADGHVLRMVLRHAWASGLARIFLLEVGGKIAAASVNFVYDGRMEAYFTAYDAAYERASPGTILIVEYAMWSFDRCLTLVDFLRGEEAFKFRLANTETVLDSFAGSRSMVGQLAISGHRWLSRWRHQRPDTAPAAAEALEAVD